MDGTRVRCHRSASHKMKYGHAISDLWLADAGDRVKEFPEVQIAMAPMTEASQSFEISKCIGET